MKLRLRDKIFFALMAIAFVYIGISKIIDFGRNGNRSSTSTIREMKIADKTLKVEEVSTPEAMYKGLGGRDQLDQQMGMLFYHQMPGTYMYVMRDMQIGLDFIFIYGNKVVDIAENVPADYKETIYGATEYDKVLEVNAGWASNNGIKLGDEIVMK